MNLAQNKNLETTANKQSYELNKAQKDNQRKQEFKKMILTDRRIADMQIVNKNLQKKLSLYDRRSNKAEQQGSEEAVMPISTFRSKRSIAYSPFGKRPEEKSKFTNYQQKIMDEYKTQLKENKASSISNPFEMALLQMIERQREMLQKRQKDLRFWQDRVKNLEQKYKELQKDESNLHEST